MFSFKSLILIIVIVGVTATKISNLKASSFLRKLSANCALAAAIATTGLSPAFAGSMRSICSHDVSFDHSDAICCYSY